MSTVIERDDQVAVSAPAGPHRRIEPLAFDRTAGLVILNQPLDLNFERLWRSTAVHVCADGGANRLYDFLGDDRTQYLPDYIVGDLDSLDAGVRRFYEDHGVVVVPQPSQYSTDFMKAVSLVLLRCEGTEIAADDDLVERADRAYDGAVRVYILGGLGGRLDHSVQSLNQMVCMHRKWPTVEVYFASGAELVFLVPKGTNHVVYGAKEALCTAAVPVCGLLPLSGPAVLDTDGLKYDVRQWDTCLGGKVSSSNGVAGQDGFVVTTSNDIVVNVETDIFQKSRFAPGKFSPC